MTPTRTVYRADHPGSYIRPLALRKARIDRAHGRISDDALREIEDRPILDVLKLQRAAGMDVYTDGEFRRKFFMSGPQSALEGAMDTAVPDYERYPRLRDVDPELLPEVTRPNMVAVGQLRLKRRITGDEVAFLKEHAPGPVQSHAPKSNYTGRPRRMVQAWSDRSLLSISRGGAAGARRIACRRSEGHGGGRRAICPGRRAGLHALMVPERRAQLRDPQEEFDRIVGQENALLARARGPGVTSGVHICLGTFFLGDPTPLGGGPPVEYDPEWTGKLFQALDADVFQVEYTGRAKEGALQALRDVPKGKVVALGMINIRDPELESQDELLRKLDEAARYFPLENLSLIANCGFAGNNAGAFMSEDQQRRKLELLVDPSTRCGVEADPVQTPNSYEKYRAKQEHVARRRATWEDWRGSAHDGSRASASRTPI